MANRILTLLSATALPLVAHAFHSITSVPRIPLKDFDKDSYQDQPLIVETGLDVESLCDNLMDAVSNEIVILQQTKRIKKKESKQKDSYQPKSKKKQRRAKNQQQKVEKETQLYEFPFDQAINLAMHKSSHDESLFSFCEGLLDTVESDEDYTGKQVLAGQKDWFDFFPPEIQPSDCIIVAGDGATSTLHRDPFEWTGTSLCLEGTKVWRFLAPKIESDDGESGIQDVDKLVKAYRLPSTAWEDGETCLSAGWQSNLNLYEERHESIPSASELYEEMTDEGVHEALEEIAQEWSLLKPNFDTSLCSCWAVVQKPGDLLLIPAHWWHQTYALEPSLAVASQRCVSQLDASRVINHILETSETTDEAPDELLKGDYSTCQEEKEIEEVIDTLFEHLENSLSV